MAEAAAEDGAAAKPAKAPLSLATIMALVNMVAILGALGTFVYTRVLFQRPPITEEQERARLEAEARKNQAPTVAGVIAFEPVTVNLKPALPAGPDASSKTLEGGKLHYATLAFALEMKDMSSKDLIENLKPVLMDRLIGMVGRKSYGDLTTVQGRYVLRTQMADAINQMLAAESGDKSKPVAVTNVYFTTFIVQ
jgi:flagellar basal body-associated protein FliL